MTSLVRAYQASGNTHVVKTNISNNWGGGGVGVIHIFVFCAINVFSIDFFMRFFGL